MIFEDIENEIWVVLLRNYLISNKGRVYSLYSNSFLNITKRSSGYCCLCLLIDGKYQVKLFHRLIAMAFIPNMENKPCVNHVNGIKSDNRVENLEWVTYKENVHHAINNGLFKFNKRHEDATVKCSWCEKEFTRSGFRDNSNKKRQAVNSFCGRKCMGLFNTGKKRKI